MQNATVSVVVLVFLPLILNIFYAFFYSASIVEFEPVIVIWAVLFQGVVA